MLMRSGGGGGGGLNDFKFSTFIGRFQSDGAAKHGSEMVNYLNDILKTEVSKHGA